MSAVLHGYAEDRSHKAHSPTLAYCVAAIERHIGALPVELIDRATGRNYIRARRQEGPRGASVKYRRASKPLSDGTLRREIGVLRRALAWAEESGWIDKAPWVEQADSPVPRERFLTKPEAQRLLDACQAPHLRVFTAIALYTGARTGAILELPWSAVDLSGARPTINFGRGRGKKRRARVPIHDELLPEIRQAAEAATTSWVIEFKDAPVASIKTGFRAAARRAGLKDVTPHVLRHTAATWMMQDGVSPSLIAQYLGNTVEVIEQRYGHHSPEWLAEAHGALSIRRSGLETGLDNRSSES